MRIFNRRNNNGSNTTEPNALIQSGYGVITPGAASSGNQAVTFPIPYTSAPIVVITFGGDAASSSAYGAGNNTVKLFAAAKAVGITNTGFTAWIYATDNTAYAAGNTAFYQWIAIGT
jgi:hypothetical protein